jgi:hypothetical protein
MNPLIQVKNATAVFFVAFACLALPAAARAVSPPPDGGYPGGNTAEGTDALFGLTMGNFNTAMGFDALYNNTIGSNNTATGNSALISNTTGLGNTANGAVALYFNNGNFNTANGFEALFQNTAGSSNTASGSFALVNNRTGHENTANGESALFNNIDGFNNTANGVRALSLNITGANNTAVGVNALLHSTGSNNIALGSSAGINLTTGNNNIDIGALGLAGESDTIRIGRVGVQKTAYMQGISGTTVGSGATVIVGSNGRLGTVQSSVRFKDEIKLMDKASEAILALKPVTFRYKKELDPVGIPQFGLVAEQVEKVNPDLVARDEKGHVYTVRYEAVNAMLLNEFLKEHKKVEELEGIVTSLAATVKEQASQIQKVSAQLEVSKPAPQTVLNNQ